MAGRGGVNWGRTRDENRVASRVENPVVVVVVVVVVMVVVVVGYGDRVGGEASVGRGWVEGGSLQTDQLPPLP